MASAIIHMCVAKKVNEVLKMDENMIFLGSIAPDISKIVGESKVASHFLDGMDEDCIPNCEKFVNKYKEIFSEYDRQRFTSRMKFKCKAAKIFNFSLLFLDLSLLCLVGYCNHH